MQLLKNVIKRALLLDAFSAVTPLRQLEHLGSGTHGYWVPSNFLGPESICYCVGAGEDISFDTELITRFGCQVVILDPMPYAKAHFELLLEQLGKGDSLTLDSGYRYAIRAEQLARAKFIELGVWHKEETVRFFAPQVDNYAGHSITNLQKSEDYVEAKVDRLSSLMQKLGHPRIDLLKLEIEGAEYGVIETIARDRPDLKMICVEFDEIFHGRGLGCLRRIKRATDQLLGSGYRLAHSTELFKRTYIRADVFDTLLLRERAR